MANLELRTSHWKLAHIIKAHHPQVHSPEALLPGQVSITVWAWLAPLEGWAAWGLCTVP